MSNIENQLSLKIALLKALDSLLMLGVLALAAYTYLYAENKEFMIFVCLGLLAVFSITGRLISKIVANTKVRLEMAKREKKIEEQRTLMSTRHTLGATRKTGTGATSNPTNPPPKKN